MDSSMIREEVVISGISGAFPYSNNIDEFRDNLLNKALLTSNDDCRWSTTDKLNIPNSTGKIRDISKFDSSHFGAHRKLTESMDPMMYIMLEKSFEALLDAGINPHTLRGTKTSVIMSTCFSEADNVFDYAAAGDGFGIMGHNRSMLATRVAYYLDVKGPSYMILSSWSGGLSALTHAYSNVATGRCSAALVGASSLALFPEMSQLYNKLGLLSPDGLTRSFDAAADGYGRSDAAVVLFLQRKQDAKRVYADILHTDVFCYGDRQSFIAPKQINISNHLKHFYENCRVNPAEVQYLEADGSAAQDNDVKELKAVEEVMLRGRKTPLLIGSVKSNIGHTEAAASLCAIAKLLVAMESGYIAPNLHYNTPVPGVTALKDGRLKVVTEKIPWTGGLAAVNAIGMDGNCGHLLLRSHPKEKSRRTDSLPRLVTVSSRTEEAVHNILTKIESMPPNPEFIRLLHDIHETSIPTHLYRGYTIVGPEHKKVREVEHFEGAKRPVWFIFSGMGSQWAGMACHLLQLQVFAEAIDRCHAILEQKGLNLKKIVTDKDPKLFDNILNCFVGIAAVQIGLVAVLRKLGIEPDGIIGHSVGELGCALADGCFTEEQMILSAYCRGMASLEANLTPGMMAAVGIGYKNLKSILPPSIEIACHNGPESCTISGPVEEMKVFVDQLTKKGVFARLVNVSNIAYHSRYVAPAGPLLLKYLKQIISNPKQRSARWISTSVPEKDWGSSLWQYSSAEYHTNNLLSSVLFEEGSLHIPKNAICIEIAPHGLLQAILRRSLDPSCTNISLTQRGHEQGLTFLLQAIGKLYMLGLQPRLAEIFPPVSLPVSRGTPSISPLVEWEHSDDWPIISFLENNVTPGETLVQLSLTQGDTRTYSGHVLEGHVVLPAAAHLKLAWTILTSIHNKNPHEMSIVFENVIFHQPVIIPKQGSVQLYFLLQRGSGMFEVLLNDKVVTTGKIIVPEDVAKEFSTRAAVETTSWTEHSLEDVYKELENRGYKYSGPFQAITSTRLSKTCNMAKIKWCNNWVAFTDCLLQLAILQSHEDSQDLRYPSFLRRAVIDMNLQEMRQEEELEAVAQRATGIVRCKGMELHGLETRPVNLGYDQQMNFQIHQQRFVSHQQPSFKNIYEFIEAGLHLALENYHPFNKSRNYAVVAELKNSHPLLPLVERTSRKLLDTWVETETVVWPNVQELKRNCVLLLATESLVQEGTKLLADTGAFLLARVPDSIIWQPDEGLVVIMEYQHEGQRLLLLRQETCQDPSASVVLMEENHAEWVKQVQASLQDKRKVYLVSYKEPPCNITSFLSNLAKNFQVHSIRCFFILDKSAPVFSLSHELYKKQLAQDLTINVYQKGQWGSYRALSLNEEPKRKSSEPSLVPFRLEGTDAHYVALTDAEQPVNSRNEMENVSYFEYSGVDNKGDRVMGLVLTKPTKSPQHYTWSVPESWSLEEAATVPEAYALAYYILKLLAKVCFKDQVLIHSGYTGIGQAAIRVALSLGAKVFTSVNSKKQRQFINETFPQLSDSQILDVESTMFESDLLEVTEGKGVSLVISGLPGEMLDASFRCLSIFGLMVQLGKDNLTKLNHMGMSRFLKNTAFHGVSTEKLLTISEKLKKQLHASLQQGIISGVVKPLERIVYLQHEIGKAKQSLADPSHSKKILISIGTGKKDVYFKKHGMLRCSPQNSYLIFGGKGDDWLSLAVWLVERGARKLVIAQQSQPITSYLARRVGLLRTCHSVDIKLLSAHKASTPLGASSLIKEANTSGSLAAIFILPLQRREPAESIEWDSSTSCAVSNLDAASRSIPLQHFVCLQCQGVERIFEDRHQSGYPALALQYEVHSNSEVDLRPILLKIDSLVTMTHEPVVIVNAVQQKADSVSSHITADRFNHLLTTSVRDLIQLGKSLTNQAVEEVPTLSPGLEFAKESAPIFLLPSLQYSSMEALKPLLKRMMSPAVLLKNGKATVSLQEHATQILKHMREVWPSGPYILVGDLWGGVVATELAQQLESQGLRMQVFLLSGAPEILRNVIGQLGQGKQFEANLLGQLFSITSDKVKEELLNLPDWESRLNTALSTITFEDETEQNLVSAATNTLHSHLRNTVSYKPLQQIESPVTLIVPIGSEGDDCELLKICKQSVNIHQTGEDHKSMLASTVTSDVINSTLIAI